MNYNRKRGCCRWKSSRGGAVDFLSDVGIIIILIIIMFVNSDRFLIKVVFSYDVDDDDDDDSVFSLNLKSCVVF